MSDNTLVTVTVARTDLFACVTLLANHAIEEQRRAAHTAIVGEQDGAWHRAAIAWHRAARVARLAGMDVLASGFSDNAVSCDSSDIEERRRMAERLRGFDGSMQYSFHEF